MIFMVASPCWSVFIRQHHTRRIAVGTRDDPEPGAVLGLIHREQAAALPQGSLVLLPVPTPHVSPIASHVASEGTGELLPGEQPLRLGTQHDAAQGEPRVSAERPNRQE